jgi:hypothetical protein
MCYSGFSRETELIFIDVDTDMEDIVEKILLWGLGDMIMEAKSLTICYLYIENQEK